MNPYRLINKLGIRSINANVVFALKDNNELRPYFRLYRKGDFSILQVETKHIEPWMLYFSTDKEGYFEFNTRHGVLRSFYTKTEYLEMVENNPLLSIAVINKRIVFGCAHESKVNKSYLRKLAVLVDKERDSQRKKLYKWQNLFDQTHETLSKVLNRAATKSLVHSVLKDYGFDLSRVIVSEVWNENRKRAIASHTNFLESRLEQDSFSAVVFEFNHTNLGTVLHELAHSIVLPEYVGQTGPVAGHGPEYCLILAELFHKYAGIDFNYTYESMRKAKLKVAPKEDFFDGKTYPFYQKL